MKKIFWLVIISMFLAALGGVPAIVSADGLMLKEMTTGNVRYIIGGVGEAERKAMEKMAQHFHLKLVFAKVNGNYLARVPFRIFNAGGEKILDTVAAGPWVLVDLAPGTYTVSAHYNGKKRSHSVDVGSGLKVQTFHWRS
jgi:hypothetical protein